MLTEVSANRSAKLRLQPAKYTCPACLAWVFWGEEWSLARGGEGAGVVVLPKMGNGDVPLDAG